MANSLDGTVSRIDPATNTVVQTIDVGNGPAGIAYAAGSVWVANTGDGTITRIDADSGRPTKTLPIAATELAFGDGTLWASQRTANRVVRIDPTTGKVVQPIAVGNGPTGIAFGSGAAWVANSLDGTVSRIDPETNSVAATIPTGNGPTAVAVDARGVWVSNQFDGTLARIDPRTNQVGAADHASATGRRAWRISGGDVLVSVRQSGAGHRGGTLTVRMNRALDSIDTAVAYDSTSWPILRMTSDGLVAFNQASGLAGTQLVPDLAVSLPTPTDGGRTYTFRLRPNIRYSNGRPVKASDVRPRSSATSRSASCRCRTTTASSARLAASRARSAATSRAGSSPTTPRGPSPSISSRPTRSSCTSSRSRSRYVVPAGTPPRGRRRRARCRQPGRT